MTPALRTLARPPEAGYRWSLMRVHHVNCGTLVPEGARWLGVPGGSWGPPRLVCHCLVVEHGDRLLLVDGGIGLQDLRDPLRRLGPVFLGTLRPTLDVAETASHRLHALGFSPRDVSDVLLTHLDPDHAGGLADFPHARVHLSTDEYRAAVVSPSKAARRRYQPIQWAHGPKWVSHGPAGEPWSTFEGVRPLDGLGPDILRVPLPGHTRGHCGYAIRVDAGWLLHAGDAILERRELGFWRHPPMGLRIYHRVMAADLRLRKRSHDQLRRCHQEHGHEIEIVCTHDAAAMGERERS